VVEKVCGGQEGLDVFNEEIVLVLVVNVVEDRWVELGVYDSRSAWCDVGVVIGGPVYVWDWRLGKGERGNGVEWGVVWCGFYRCESVMQKEGYQVDMYFQFFWIVWSCFQAVAW
jgi:hypothetical protein